jgi:LacI family transcriptional regulator
MFKKSLTIYDIAEEAHVSPATVSRVLTGNAKVSEKKKAIVQEIMDRHNFQPNALARSLLKKESMMIGFILPDITNPFFSAVFLEAEKHALNNGYTILLCNSMNDGTGNSTKIESLYMKTLLEKQVDGIILMGGRINETVTVRAHAEEVREVTRKVPVVMVNGRMAGVNCYRVRTNEEAGMVRLVEYLHKLGHRKVGFVAGLKGVTSTDSKVRTFLETAERLHMEYREEWIVPGAFSIEGGRESMITLLKNRELPTAVLAVNDFAAIGAVKAAVEQGIKIPEDMSITGFDDIYLTDIVSPRITTVNQNYSELGKTAVDVIIAAASGRKIKKDIVVDTRFVEKESCWQLLL